MAGRAAAGEPTTSPLRWTTTSSSEAPRRATVEPRPRSWRDLMPLAPAILLCLVAVAQVYLTRAERLTPWKGGGFGMFSTNDDGSRPIGIRISGPAGDHAVSIPTALSGQWYRASLLPSRRRLTRLGREIAAIERANGVAVSQVRLAVWRMGYDPRTLAGEPVLVRDLVVDVSASRRGP